MIYRLWNMYICQKSQQLGWGSLARLRVRPMQKFVLGLTMTSLTNTRLMQGKSRVPGETKVGRKRKIPGKPRLVWLIIPVTWILIQTTVKKTAKKETEEWLWGWRRRARRWWRLGRWLRRFQWRSDVKAARVEFCLRRRRSHRFRWSRRQTRQRGPGTCKGYPTFCTVSYWS